MKPDETPADIRREKNLDLEDVARGMGGFKQNVSAFELGKRGATDDQVASWARAVGVPFARAYRAIWRMVARDGRAKVREAQSRLKGPIPRKSRG